MTQMTHGIEVETWETDEALAREPHGSIPGNPLLAEPLYLTKYIERMGTGTRDMIRKCVAAGLEEPEFKLTDGFVSIIRRPGGQVAGQVGTGEAQVGAQEAQDGATSVPATPQVTPQVLAVLQVVRDQPRSREELQEAAGIRDREYFRKAYLGPLVSDGWLTRTIPDKPTSRLQKYRLTGAGRAVLEEWEKDGGGG